MNEVYARTKVIPKNVKEGEDAAPAIELATEALMEELDNALDKAINQPGVAKVQVQRWYPGVIQEICEELDEKSHKNVTHRLLQEASSTLERKQTVQTMATKGRSIGEILGNDVEKGEPSKGEKVALSSGILSTVDQPKPRRRIRQKMRSTPVVGGGLFGEAIEVRSGRDGSTRVSDIHNRKNGDGLDWAFGTGQTGIPAEISVKGEIFNIRIAKDTWNDLRKGFKGQMVDHRGIEISQMNIEASDDAPIVQRLTGFVRNMPLRSISEEDGHLESVSEKSLETSRHGNGLSTTDSMDEHEEHHA